MKKAFDQYRWIAGSTRAGGTVWEGPDHFLFIETQALVARVSESYRRIDFRNVQAITITKTQHRIWYFVVGFSLLLLGILFLVSGMADGNPGWHVVALIFSVPGLLVIIANLIKGPSVRAKILTAVQVLTVKGIKRQKAAYKLAARAAELCMIHQGELPRTSSDQSFHGSAPAAVPLQGVKIKLPFSGSRSVTWACITLIAAGASQAVDSFTSITALTVTSSVLVTIAGVLCIAGLGRNRGRELPPAILGSLWTGIFMTVAIGIGQYALLMVSHFETIADPGNSTRIFSGFDVQSFREMAKIGFPEWPRVAIAMIVSGAVLVLAGLIALPSAIAAKRLYQGNSPG